ncbi:NOP9 [Lepeophtheirus salmonis]|uniref:NOP9 n=1 Tax=Lepeophtheirus salmonis TaxID=72036 RepID=A0A7R8D7L9_LEPSM|nr:NOP9 [Lepeophtheirus salmonis]CAF3001256.1 NOP9 [Lepeophtheirus salmonis]
MTEQLKQKTEKSLICYIEGYVAFSFKKIINCASCNQEFGIKQIDLFQFDNFKSRNSEGIENKSEIEDYYYKFLESTEVNSRIESKKFGKQGRYGKGRSIDSDSYNYLLRVLETLNNQPFESSEEKVVFITNVFEQTEDKEVDICCNQLGSRVIETLLPEVEDFRITERFMEALTKDMRVMMSDPFGKSFSKFAINNFDFFAEDLSKHAIEQGSKVKTNKEYSFATEGNDGFQESMEGMISKIENFEQLKDRLWDSCVLSSIIQSLLYTLSKYDLGNCKVMVKFLLKCVFDTNENFTFENVAMAQLLEMLISVTNEHFPKAFQKLYDRFLDGKFSEMIDDPNCNFLLQKLLRTIIVESNQYQIIVVLAQACNRLSAKQSHFSVALMKALGIYDQSSNQNKIVSVLAYLDNKKESENPEKSINKAGSQIIQELLKFNKPIKTVNSLLSMDSIDLRSLLSDPKGCHITDVFMGSKSIGEKSRDGLIKALQGHMRLLCCSKFGSRSFDAIWKGSSAKGRDIIAAELSKEANLLKSNTYGQFIHNNLNLVTYKRNYSEWKSGISAKRKETGLDIKDKEGDSESQLTEKKENTNHPKKLPSRIWTIFTLNVEMQAQSDTDDRFNDTLGVSTMTEDESCGPDRRGEFGFTEEQENDNERMIALLDRDKFNSYVEEWSEFAKEMFVALHNDETYDTYRFSGSLKKLDDRMSGTTPVDTDNSSLVVEEWPYYQEDDSLWQRKEKCLRNRSEKCFGSREMSDIGILSVDENWWFGDTVKDFYSHKFLLGSASPVLHHILYEMELSESSKEIVLNLNPKLNVTLTRTKTYDSERLELNGIPPIATEALLEYIYKDKFLKSDYENGYSRNLLWRLWHASKALEMDHLSPNYI